MSRTLIIQDGENEYGGQIGTIRATRLGYEDHGILTADITVEWPGGGVSVGGYCLDQNDKDRGRGSRKGTAYGLDHIIRILEVVGVSKWESLVGQKVIVLFNGTSVWGAQSVGLAHATDEGKVFVMKEHAEYWNGKEEA